MVSDMLHTYRRHSKKHISSQTYLKIMAKTSNKPSPLKKKFNLNPSIATIITKFLVALNSTRPLATTGKNKNKVLTR